MKTLVCHLLAVLTVNVGNLVVYKLSALAYLPTLVLHQVVDRNVWYLQSVQ